MLAVPGAQRCQAARRKSMREPPEAFVREASPIVRRWLANNRAAFTEEMPRPPHLDHLLRRRVRRVWRYVMHWLHESGPAAQSLLVSAVIEDLDALHARLAGGRRVPRTYRFETADALAGLYPASLGRLSTRLGEQKIDLGVWWRSGRPALPTPLEGAFQDSLREMTLAGLPLAFLRDEPSPGAAAFAAARMQRHRRMPDIVALAEAYIGTDAEEGVGEVEGVDEREGEGEENVEAIVLRRLDVLDHIERTRESVLATMATDAQNLGRRTIGRDFTAPPRVAFYRRMALVLWGSDWAIAPADAAARRLCDDIHKIWRLAAACHADSRELERFRACDDELAQDHRPLTQDVDEALAADAEPGTASADRGGTRTGETRKARKRSFRLQRAQWREMRDALHARSWAVRAMRAASAEADADVRRFANAWRADAQLVFDGIFAFAKGQPAKRRLGWLRFARFEGHVAMTGPELVVAVRDFGRAYRRARREHLLENFEEVVDRWVPRRHSAGAKG